MTGHHLVPRPVPGPLGEVPVPHLVGGVQLRLRPTPHALAALVVAGKVLLLLCMLRAAVDPQWAHLEGKAPVARAVLFPLWSVTVPVVWLATRRATGFPWRADLLVMLTCGVDLLGNRLDLYDSIAWFDDAVHLLNAALVSLAFVLIAERGSATAVELVEAAVAVGMTASLAWELFEYATFLTRSTEWTSAYSDTMGDLALGWLGSLAAALGVLALRRLSAPASRGRVVQGARRRPDPGQPRSDPSSLLSSRSSETMAAKAASTTA
jgi:hypothetical protein